MGNSASSSSYQYADAQIAQSYQGTCDINCENSMNNVDITFINSNVGNNVNVTQSCAVNGQCLFNNTMDSTADVIFKASNSANAAAAILQLPSFDSSSTFSLQSIQENINESTSQTCDVSSINQMNNLNFFAANTDISGSVNIGQSGVTNGNCQLNDSMRASAYASGTIDNCAAAGKAAKGKCSLGKGSSSITYFLIILLIIVVAIVLIIVGSHFISKYSKSKGSSTPVGSK
jgi:hypothetical protein